MRLTLDRSRALPFLTDRDALDGDVLAAHRRVLNGETRSPEMLGWRRMLLDPDDALLESVQQTANEIRDRADVLVCVGIGGSYLGAEAVNAALAPYFGGDGPEVIFAGHHLSPGYHQQLLQHLEGKSVYVNVISKSGTTLEPALAFRFLRRYLEDHFEDSSRRIIATTDAESGVLRQLANEKGYRSYVVPDGVGGRFSVLTPVGLLPIAAAVLRGRRGRARRDGRGRGPSRAGLCRRPVRLPRGRLYRGADVGDGAEAPRLRVLVAAALRRERREGGQRPLPGHAPVHHRPPQRRAVRAGGQAAVRGELPPPGRRRQRADTGRGGGQPGPTQRPRGDALRHRQPRRVGGHCRGAPRGRGPQLDLDAPPRGHTFEHAVAVGGTLLEVDPFDQPGVEAYKKKMFRLLGRD